MPLPENVVLGDPGHVSDTNKAHKKLNGLPLDIREFGTTGTSDDSSVIQSALNQGGGIYFPPGTYLAAGLNIAVDNTYLLGAGMSSVIKLKDGSNTNLLTNASGASAQRFFVTIQNLKLDGNKANNSSGHCLRLYSAHSWLLDRLHISNAAGNAVKVEGQSGALLALNNQIRNCRLENSTNQALFLGGFAPNNHIHHCIIGGCSNFYCIEDANTENVFIGNHIHTSASHGVYFNGSTNSIFQGNFVESSNASGVKVETTTVGVRIEGNVCFNNGLTSAGDGINIAGTDCSVMGNRCFDRQGTKTQDYGIQLIAGSLRNLVIGNHARTSENQTGGILDSGTNTLANNQTA